MKKIFNYIKNIRLITNIDEWLSEEEWKIVRKWVMKIAILTLLIFIINEFFLENGIVLVTYQKDDINLINEILINIIISIFTIVIPLLMIPIDRLSKKYNFIKDSFIKESQLLPIILFSLFTIFFIIFISLGNNFSIIGYLLGLLLFSIIIFHRNKKKIIIIISILIFTYLFNFISIYLNFNSKFLTHFYQLVDSFSKMALGRIYVTYYLSMSLFILLTQLFVLLKLLVEIDNDEKQIDLLKTYFSDNKDKLNSKNISLECKRLINIIEVNYLYLNTNKKEDEDINKIKNYLQECIENPEMFKGNYKKIFDILLWNRANFINNPRKISFYELISRNASLIKNPSYFYIFEITEKIIESLNNSNEYYINLWIDFYFNELLSIEKNNYIYYLDFIEKIFMSNNINWKTNNSLIIVINKFFSYLDIQFSKDQDGLKVEILLRLFKMLENEKQFHSGKELWFDYVYFNQKRKLDKGKFNFLLQEILKITLQNNDDENLSQIIQINKNDIKEILKDNYQFLSEIIFIYLNDNVSDILIKNILDIFNELEIERFIENLLYYIDLKVLNGDEVLSFYDIDYSENIPKYYFSIILYLLVYRNPFENDGMILNYLGEIINDKPFSEMICEHSSEIIYLLNKFKFKIINLDCEYDNQRMENRIQSLIIEIKNPTKRGFFDYYLIFLKNIIKKLP